MARPSRAAMGLALGLHLASSAQGASLRPRTRDGDAAVAAPMFLAPPEPRIDFECINGTDRLKAWPNSTATDWAASLRSDACKRELRQNRVSRTSLYCGTSKLTYSASRGLAYLETPKAGADDIRRLFESTFQDARQVSVEELPGEAFVFTFVREPVAQKIAVFAEADSRRQQQPPRGDADEASHSTFDAVDPTQNDGVDRFLAFFGDMQHDRLDADAIESLLGGHAASQLQACGHRSGMLPLSRLGFVGHLENVAADWGRLQELAGVPEHLRMRARAFKQVATFKDFNYARALEASRTDALVRRVCDLFQSDYMCLGYPLPPTCAEAAPSDGGP